MLKEIEIIKALRPMMRNLEQALLDHEYRQLFLAGEKKDREHELCQLALPIGYDILNYVEKNGGNTIDSILITSAVLGGLLLQFMDMTSEFEASKN